MLMRTRVLDSHFPMLKILKRPPFPSMPTSAFHHSLHVRQSPSLPGPYIPRLSDPTVREGWGLQYVTEERRTLFSRGNDRHIWAHRSVGPSSAVNERNRGISVNKRKFKGGRVSPTHKNPETTCVVCTDTHKQRGRSIKKMEEEKREEAQRVVVVELKHGDDRTQTVLLTAGTAALLMAWVKRAAVVCLVEQWRAWVFLALNLVLLAIVFTSARSSPTTTTTTTNTTSEDGETKRSSDNSTSDDNDDDDDNNNNNNNNSSISSSAEKEVVEMAERRRKKECRWSGAEQVRRRRRSSGNLEATERVDEALADAESDSSTRGVLSKEELNERVEAFITMFRQHLVLDARRGRLS